MIVNRNAESLDSPFRSSKSKFYLSPEVNSAFKKINGVKRQFPEKRYGNNRQSPNFLRVNNVFENQLSYSNPYLDSKKMMIHPHVNSNSSSKFLPKQNFILKKHLESHSDKYVSSSLNPITNMNTKMNNSSINPNLIRLNLPPIADAYDSSYLKNVNDYNISENYKVNEGRLVKFSKKPVEDYNCITSKVMKFRPTHIECDNEPAFYENYNAIKDQSKAFHKKGGLFTYLIDKKLVDRSASKSIDDIFQDGSNSGNNSSNSAMPHIHCSRNHTNDHSDRRSIYGYGDRKSEKSKIIENNVFGLKLNFNYRNDKDGGVWG